MQKIQSGTYFEVVVHRQITQEMRIGVTADNAKQAMDEVKAMPKIHGKNGWTTLPDHGEPEIVGATDKGPIVYGTRRFRGREQQFSTGRPAE